MKVFLLSTVSFVLPALSVAAATAFFETYLEAGCSPAEALTTTSITDLAPCYGLEPWPVASLNLYQTVSCEESKTLKAQIFDNNSCTGDALLTINPVSSQKTCISLDTGSDYVQGVSIQCL
ncbi:hypothetical protein BGW36DRAFT_422542 [Talaromyces proteolyticus]|uniref:Cyanovirin-N domain-containing protein n=1 Tax=Talaromyces proteolyticus TaxID=1131652 RepID=A0AAD4L2I4_9EURO|nr:uncharacterized protein BGW36DRAFT_422542 [Talaromyces proteolyticus]KAH8706019.1 hypothetical protein BGW36DRAFT_422542 [Talaromyces proteolyticus]